MIRLLQVNLNHCIAAQALLEQTIRERRINVAIISEPHHRETFCPRSWICDRSGKAAIWLCGTQTSPLSDTRCFDGFVRAKMADMRLYSCYLAPSLHR